MKGAQGGITGVYPKASHLSEDLLFAAYRNTAVPEQEPDPTAGMSDLEIRQRHLAAPTIEAEQRAANTRRRLAVVR